MDFETREDLLAYARLLEDSTVYKARIKATSDSRYSELVSEDIGFKSEYRGKGGYGEYLEERYFFKKNDNESQPDFPNLNIELKVSPLKRLQSGELTVKERLVLNHFTFTDIVKEDFDTSKFVYKNAHILLVFYLWQKAVQDFGDIQVDLVDMWDVLLRDYNQIRADWEFIVTKIRRGEAHLLSEGDTILLGACTKGENAEKSMQAQPFSDIPARGRALCFKTSYIKSIYRTLTSDKKNRVAEKSLQLGSEWQPLEILLHKRLDRFYGLPGRKIAKLLGVTYNEGNKSRYASLARNMLGLFHQDDTYHELDAGNIQIKSIRIETDGRVKESMSFRNVYFKDIVDEDWEDSLYYEELTSKFIFMIFQKRNSTDDDYFFDGFMLWNMPLQDIEKARLVWEDTKRKVEAGNYEHFTQKSENEVAHVRPKGQNKLDLMETPQGTMEKKKAFWLNNTYIKKIMDTRPRYRPLQK